MIPKHLAIAGRSLSGFALRALVLVGVGMTIAGCQTTAQEQDEYTGSIWTDYRKRHPIAIREKDRTLDVFVGSARHGLMPDQRASVLDFAVAWREDGTGRFVIERPTHVRNARAAAVAVSEIRSILTAAGVPSNAIRVQSHRVPERNALAVVTVSYPRLAAQVDGCGQWPDDLGPSADKKHFENLQYWNYGCATRANMAAMVANPADLVQPRAETQIYAGRRSIVLDKYRKGEGPATTYPNPDKGAISDLGK